MPVGQIISSLQDALPRLRSRYGVQELGLFGSAARGSDDPDSDLDILVRFLPGTSVTLFSFSRLACDLEDLLGRRVDLVEDHAGLRPEFRATMQRDLIRVA
jgi:predicted nucleotidyltransferase